MASRAKMWWQQATTLIIDEISMIDADLFEKIDYVGQVIRKQPNKPFGGMHRFPPCLKMLLIASVFKVYNLLLVETFFNCRQ